MKPTDGLALTTSEGPAASSNVTPAVVAARLVEEAQRTSDVPLRARMLRDARAALLEARERFVATARWIESVSPAERAAAQPAIVRFFEGADELTRAIDELEQRDMS